MPIFSPWDIVKVPFPYTNRPVQQRRPALVVSTGEHLLWVLMITSAENRGWPGDVDVDNLMSAGLPSASVVRTAKIATIDARSAEPLGNLSSAVARSEVARHLRMALAVILAEPLS